MPQVGNNIGEEDDDHGDTRPEKRQKTLSKVCENCRQKKAKCDSTLPRCDPCRRKGINCVYREKGQPGLRAGYGTAMMTRLDTLESSVTKITSSLDGVLVYLSQQREQPLQLLQDPLVNTVDTSIVGNTAVWHQESQHMPTAIFDPSLGPVIPDGPTVVNTRDAELFGTGLLPSDILDELVKLYFDFIYPWLPLLRRPQAYTGLVLAENTLILHGLVVVAFRLWQKPLPSFEERQVYIKTSQDYILRIAVDSCTIASTQALTLLAVDTLGNGTGPRAWNVVGMLVIAVRHLSIVKAKAALVQNEDSDDEGYSLMHEAEDKRRLYWSIMMLDRFCSAQHGQQGGIQSRGSQVAMPISDTDWSHGLSADQSQTPLVPLYARATASYWHHYIDLLYYMNEINQMLVQPINLSGRTHCQEWQSNFRRLDSTLTSWFESLPLSVKTPPPAFDAMFVMLHATYHLTKTRMYTVAAFPSTKSPYLTASSFARHRCREATSSLARLAGTLQPDQLERLGPLFAFTLWVASRSLVIMRSAGLESIVGHVKNDLDTLVKALDQLSLRWPCARRYHDLVKMMSDAEGGVDDIGSSGSPEVNDFIDTRKTTYGLEMRLSMLKQRQILEAASQPFDFLDMPFDLGDDGWMTAGLDFDSGGEWLKPY